MSPPKSRAESRRSPADAARRGSVSAPTKGQPRGNAVPAPATTGNDGTKLQTGPLPGPLRVMAFNCETLAEVEPQSLGLTYEFVAAPTGAPYSVTVRLEGRRIGVKRQAGPTDRFDVSMTVDRVLPGSGRITVTTRVPNLPPGRWHVVARPSARLLEPSSDTPVRQARAVLPRLPGGSVEGATGWAPQVNVMAPGVKIGAWPGLVLLGTVTALALQIVLAGRLHLPVARVVLLFLTACLVGLMGAKLYYLVLHPAERRRPLYAGMCIQGFVLGAAAVLTIGSWLVDLRVGTVLDVTAPGLMFGMTIGRFGCFFGGCCAGRPTTSRWGLWSSDRRVGQRRIPTQLMEAALAASIGLVTLLVLLTIGKPVPAGALFLAAAAAYTFGRQLLFPLRGLPRQTRHGRLTVMAVAAIALLAAITAAILA